MTLKRRLVTWKIGTRIMAEFDIGDNPDTDVVVSSDDDNDDLCVVGPVPRAQLVEELTAILEALK